MKIAVLAGSWHDVDRLVHATLSHHSPNEWIYVGDVGDMEGHTFDGVEYLFGWDASQPYEDGFWDELTAHTRVAGRIKGGLL